MLLLSFVVLTFASVKTENTTTEHDHGTQHDHGKNRPTKQAHGNRPCLPCEFLDREFLDVNF